MRNIDVRQVASQMISLHGDGAEIAAAIEAGAMLDQKDTEGFHIWERVVDVIRAIPGGSQARANL